MGKNFINTFDFVGDMATAKDKEKILTTQKFESGWNKEKLTLAVQESKTNSVFLEVSAMYNPDKTFPIKSFGKNGKPLEIPYKDRNKQNILDMVADFKKVVVDLETDFEKKAEYDKLSYKINALERKDELSNERKKDLKEYKEKYQELATNRHEFINDKDLVEFLHANLDVLTANKVRVRGNIEMSEWKGKYYTTYIPTHFELVEEETPSKLKAKVDVYFEKDALDESCFKDTKKIFVSGYLQNYDRNVKENRYFPKDFIINGEKLDMEDEKHVKYLDFLKDNFSCGEKNKNHVHHMIWEITVYRGAEVHEITYDDLTKSQKTAVDLGINKLSDFKKNILGNTVDEYRAFRPALKIDEFAEGTVDTGFKLDDFLEKVARNTADIRMEQAKKDEVKPEKREDKNSEEKKEEEKSSLEDELENLFS